MEDFRWHFDNFISEILNTAFRYFRDTNREYKEIKCYLDSHSNRFDEILNSLNEGDRKFAREYIDKTSYKASCCDESLYIEGYKDCVKLLKEIGVI